MAKSVKETGTKKATKKAVKNTDEIEAVNEEVLVNDNISEATNEDVLTNENTSEANSEEEVAKTIENELDTKVEESLKEATPEIEKVDTEDILKDGEAIIDGEKISEHVEKVLTDDPTPEKIEKEIETLEKEKEKIVKKVQNIADSNTIVRNAIKTQSFGGYWNGVSDGWNN